MPSGSASGSNSLPRFVQRALSSQQFKEENLRLVREQEAVKEPFRSWYDGKVWEGPLVLRAGGSVIVTSSQDDTLCQNFMFSPMDDHRGGIPGRSEPPRSVAVEHANQVLEALAEGFRVALAAW